MFPKINDLSCNVFISAPEDGAGVFGAAYYCENDSCRLQNIGNYALKGDSPDTAFVRYSDDNGVTWGQAEPLPGLIRETAGVRRVYYRGGFLDESCGRYFSLRNEGFFPNENYSADECMKSLQLYYQVSKDGGRSFYIDEPIIQKSDGYDTDHPLPGVWKGCNSIMLGDYGCSPLRISDGTILVPCQISPLDDNKKYVNPGGGYTYHNAVVMRARWNAGGGLDWELSEMVVADPELTTRGLLEPTLANLADGRILMIMRGCNVMMTSRNPDKTARKDGLAGRKWCSISEDGGWTWRQTVPWTFSDDSDFYSPGACSQLLHHSSGKIYWFGNISPDNTYGNSPRYPLVAGEVDAVSGKLIKASIRIIDDRQQGEREDMTLSNFHAREDRNTGEIVLLLPRLRAKRPDMHADLLEYRFVL